MIHPLSDVQTTNIGDTTNIWQFTVILKGAKIGSNCNINCNCFIENDVIIGDNVTVKAGVYIWDGVRIGDGAFIGPCVAFTNDRAPRSKRYLAKLLTTTIGEKASIGANSTLLPGVTIGNFALVGAGSVVTKDVPAHSLCYGNPARIKGYVCECGQKLNEDLTCRECGKMYFRTNTGSIEAKQTATGTLGHTEEK